MTVSITINNRPNKRGLYLILIRASHRGKRYFNSSEIYVKENEFDKKAKYGHWIIKRTDRVELNEALKRKIVSVERTYQLGEDVSPERALLHDNFFKYAYQFAEKYNNEDQRGTYRIYQSKLSKLKLYAGASLKFSDITVKFIREYIMYLKTKENQVNTIGVDLKKIRAIIRQAVKEDIVPHEKNAFNKISIESKRTSKEKLTKEELDLIRNVELVGYKKEARDIFLFCINCMGMRIGSALKLKSNQIQKGLLNYQMDKGGKTKNIVLTDEAIEIVKRYGKGKYLFTYLENKEDIFKSISSATTLINKGLKEIRNDLKIDKHISTHVARHSFARMAIDAGIDVPTTQNMLGHSSLRTTQIYIGELSDEAGNEALGKIFGK